MKCLGLRRREEFRNPKLGQKKKKISLFLFFFPGKIKYLRVFGSDVRRITRRNLVNNVKRITFLRRRWSSPLRHRHRRRIISDSPVRRRRRSPESSCRRSTIFAGTHFTAILVNFLRENLRDYSRTQSKNARSKNPKNQCRRRRTETIKLREEKKKSETMIITSRTDI